MDTEILILIFIVIFNIIFLGLLGYLIYLSIKSLCKLFKSRKTLLNLSNQQKAEYLENRDVKKNFIVGWILIYIIAIERIIRSYFFPDLGMATTLEELSQYKVTIELMISFVALSWIPCFLILQKAFEKGPLKKIPFPLLIGLSTIFPAFAFANIFLTGDLLFSTALVIYGVLFTVISLKFR